MFSNVIFSYKTCVALLSLLINCLSIVECAPFEVLQFPNNYFINNHNPHPTPVVFGCLLKKSLCRSDEYCANDKKFGRCTSLNEPVQITGERDIPDIVSNNLDNNFDQKLVKEFKKELLRLSKLGITWTDVYAQCLLNFIVKNSYVPQDDNICLEYLDLPTKTGSDNTNNVKSNQDDPLRKYKNGPRIYKKAVLPSISQASTVKSDEISAFPFLLIRGKNLPLLQPKPEVRVLRSADFFNDNDDNELDDYEDNTVLDEDFSLKPEVKNNKDNEEDVFPIPYIVLENDDDDALKESYNRDDKNSVIFVENDPSVLSLDDSDKKNILTDSNSYHDKEIDDLIDSWLNSLPKEQKNKDGYEQFLKLFTQPDVSHDGRGTLVEEEEEEEEDENKDNSDNSDNSDGSLQQETIYGTINYNNANDEETKRLSNFFRKHRYDIKKPGPKYIENYFFEDFLEKPKNRDSFKPTQKDDEAVEEDNNNDDDKNGYNNNNNVDNVLQTYSQSFIDNSKIQPLTVDGTDKDESVMQEDNTKYPKNSPSVFENKLVTEDPEEQTIRSSLPLSEGPVKVDAKLQNTLIIRKADQNEPTSLEAIDSTHTYVVMDKQINIDSSKYFIKTLEQIFRLPRGTFSNLRLEKQQITFKVNPNYRDLNASQVAGKIEENAKMLREITGFSVQESGIGNRAKLAVISELLTKRENQRLIHYTLLICSGILASLAAAFVILVFRRNMKFREKVKGLMKGADEFMKTDYADIIRQRIRRDTPTKQTSQSDKKDKKDKKKIEKISERTSSEGDKQVVSPSSRSSTSSWSEEPVTSNMDIATGHLVLTYMEGHLKKKDRLDKEWEALCAYEVDPCSTNAASQAQNASKNRSPDVLPYDHSRVILNDLVNASKSDYINANSITDSDPRNPAYIATQGPMNSTRADFWQMVWEQGSVCIVMLTRLRENGMSLCDRYWPEEGAEIYHDYEVHLVSEHIWCDDYLVRSFYLKNLKTSETRTVTQFHFLSWPESGLPPSTKSLLDFRRKINKSYKGRSCPVIVHCSDGNGRTGTYILIDMVLNRLSKGAKEIDIAASLEHLRDQRIGLVKSKQQFEFVLLAVADEVQAILKSLAQN